MSLTREEKGNRGLRTLDCLPEVPEVTRIVVWDEETAAFDGLRRQLNLRRGRPVLPRELKLDLRRMTSTSPAIGYVLPALLSGSVIVSMVLSLPIVGPVLSSTA